MEIVRSLLSVLWISIAVLLTGFVLWRKLRHERVDNEDKVFDLLILSLLGSLVVGRLVYILFHLDKFSTDIAKWLMFWQFSGFIGVVSVVTGLLFFWKLLKSDWKDAIELVDYISIACAFLLFLLTAGDVVTQLIMVVQGLVVQSNNLIPAFDLRTIVVSVIYLIVYGCLFLFLSKVEKNYRTFLWYRARRRSAQTGFVVACFMIGFGFVGFLLSWFSPMSMGIMGLGLDPIVKLLVMTLGFVILYVRSGRSLFHQN